MDVVEAEHHHEHEDVLNVLRRRLRTSDAIMEHDILNTLKLFIANGGSPEARRVVVAEVVASLAEGYRGFAQMTNLVSHWLILAGKKPAEIDSLVTERLKHTILTTFDAEKADRIFTEVSAAPDWLEFMMAHTQWRQLLYQLSEQHEDSLMLSFAIQKISDAGHHDEIVSLPSASNYFSIFNRVLLHLIVEILPMNEEKLGQALPTFIKMACHNENTYLYTQAVLHHLCTRYPKAAHLQRLVQELNAHVANKTSASLVRRVDILFSNITKWNADLLASVSSILTSQTCTPGDVIKLYTLYSDTNPPPAVFLRHPVLLDVMVKALFTPSKEPNQRYLDKYIFLLAYAASVKDERTMDATPNESADAAAIDKSRLASTTEALHQVYEICHANTNGNELSTSVAVLETNLSYPVVAMALLHWISTNLLDPGFYTSSYYVLRSPILIHLLRLIIERHALQHEAVFLLLTHMFELKTALDALTTLDLKRQILDNLIHMISFGYVLPVIRQVCLWSKAEDQSLTRYFIVKILDLVEPPFSAAFCNELLRIIDSPPAIHALRAPESRTHVIHFLEYCTHNYAPDYVLSLEKLQELTVAVHSDD